jgi:hypothetical protein
VTLEEASHCGRCSFYDNPLADGQSLLTNNLALGVLGCILFAVSLHNVYHVQTTPLSVFEIFSLKVLSIVLILLACLGLVRVVLWNWSDEQNMMLHTHPQKLTHNNNDNNTNNNTKSQPLCVFENQKPDTSDPADDLDSPKLPPKFGTGPTIRSLTLPSPLSSRHLYPSSSSNHPHLITKLNITEKPCASRFIVIVHVTLLVWVAILSTSMCFGFLMRSATLHHYWHQRLGSGWQTTTDSWWNSSPWFPSDSKSHAISQSFLEASSRSGMQNKNSLSTEDGDGGVNWLLLVSERKLALITATSLFIVFYSVLGSILAYATDDICYHSYLHKVQAQLQIQQRKNSQELSNLRSP